MVSCTKLLALRSHIMLAFCAMKNIFTIVSDFFSRILNNLTGYEHYYHCTFSKELVDSGKFFPLSHFGSLTAAKQRLSEAKEAQKAEKPGHIIEVQLNLKNSLILTDTGGEHGFATWRTMLECVDTIDIPQSLLNYIFLHPSQKTLGKLKKELISDSLFDPDNIPHVNPYANHCKLDDAKACVTTQRLIQTLESLGYDSVQYTNRHKDRNHTNYVIFRPDKQVKIV